MNIPDTSYPVVRHSPEVRFLRCVQIIIKSNEYHGIPTI
nr:MAG TPA: hypothetical protein [Caudoviricetes sp.]